MSRGRNPPLQRIKSNYKREKRLFLLFNLYGIERTHFMAAVAADAFGCVDLDVVLGKGQCLCRANVDTFSASSAFFFYNFALNN